MMNKKLHETFLMKCQICHDEEVLKSGKHIFNPVALREAFFGLPECSRVKQK